MLNYLFEVSGEESDLCGEQFFVQVDPDDKSPLKKAWKIARENFKGEALILTGLFSDEMAEMLGFDTY